MLRFLHLMVSTKNGTLATAGPFDTLPLEITQYIANCLPASAAAAFAMCNHYLSQAVGAQYWSSLRDPCQSKERERFLQLLDRDLPDHLFCHRCARLHLPKPAGVNEWGDAKQYRRMRERQCFSEDFKAMTGHYFSYSFRFEHVQMAMKLYHLGLDVKKYLKTLACVERSICGFPNLKIFDARIVSDEVITRTQHWLLWPAGQVIELSQETYPCPQVCAHLESNPYYNNDNRLTALLQCKIDHINKNQTPCPQCTGLKQCWYCPTEMQIDVKVFEGQGTALVVTKWLAVGAGISPLDPKWRSHLRDEDFQPVREPFPFIVGTIRNAFEQQADFYFESLLTPKMAQQLIPKTRNENWSLTRHTWSGERSSWKRSWQNQSQILVNLLPLWDSVRR